MLILSILIYFIVYKIIRYEYNSYKEMSKQAVEEGWKIAKVLHDNHYWLEEQKLKGRK